MKALILNNLPIETGIGHYAYMLLESMKPDVELINFLPTKHDRQNLTFYGEMVESFTNSRTINFLARQMVNRTIIKRIDEFDGLIHYAAPSMFPVGNYSAENRLGTIHDMFPLEYSYKHCNSFIMSLYLRKSLTATLKIPNVIVFTEWMRDKLRENYSYAGKIYVVPHAYAKWFDKLDVERTTEVFPKKEGEHYILSVSTDKPRKNLKILPEVMNILGVGYKLVRVGPGVSDSITLDHLSPIQLAQVYRSCDALIFPSLDEGFGYPIVEAFASALPVAASDIPVFKEIGGNAVEYFDPNKPEDAAEALKKIISDKEKYVKKSIERAKLYSPELFAQRMREVYNSII